MINDPLFVDTSAFYALMDRSDAHHKEAAHLWASLLEQTVRLQTSNYVVLETLALIQGRLGFEAAHLWRRDVLGIVEVLWVDAPVHNLAHELWLSLGRRRLSFVDCVSFVTIRQNKGEKVFCFDPHFAEQGFEILAS